MDPGKPNRMKTCDRSRGRSFGSARTDLCGFLGWLLAGSIAALLAPAANGQILDDAWQGREEAARFLYNSMEKERNPPDWAGSIEELKSGIKLSPEPYQKASILDSGRWVRHYLPYFYLGQAYFRQGDCPTAVEWLSTSLAKGEVCKGTRGEPKELEKWLVKCEQRGAAPAQPARELVRSECSKVVVARGLVDAAVCSERFAVHLAREDAWNVFAEIGPR